MKMQKRLLPLFFALILAFTSAPWSGPLTVKAEGEFEQIQTSETAATSGESSDTSFSWDNATVYFVLTDRFLNADQSNDHSYGRGLKKDGSTPIEGLDTCTNPGTFHGGDIKGLTQKVKENYFNDLGVNAIWITAPYEQIHGYTSGNKRGDSASEYPDPEGGGFPYYSYHGYWTLDYTQMDENMGTAAEFAEFVDSCHERGIRVIMDVVMNHVGYVTMKDADEYGFAGGIAKDDWETYYYGNSTLLTGGKAESQNYWNSDSDDWASKWWGPGFVRADYKGYTAAGGDDTHMSLSGLPDVVTEKSAAEVPVPPLLVTKWTREGRLAQEKQELEDFFSKNGYQAQPRYYIIKWLTDWVREYGVDGFRCDTAKHVDLDAWSDLKKEADKALKEWRNQNPDKAGAQWTDDFWMTGECWGHGWSKSQYHTQGGFDSMINFSFPKDGNPAGMEKTYSDYAFTMNNDPEHNTLSYVASHDDSACAGVFGVSAAKSKGLATSLLLAPGGVQIYYGNELNRSLGWTEWFSNDYQDQRFRTDMNWEDYDPDILKHWQKVGQFRNRHLAIGAGQHEMLSESPYTFSRVYNEDEDKVVVCIPGAAGTYNVNVGNIFEDGETVKDAYSGSSYEVSGGTVSVTCDENGLILLEGSGIVKASVSAKASYKTPTYQTDTITVTLKANKAENSCYSVNGGKPKAYQNGQTLTLGGSTAYEEESTLTLTGTSQDDGTALSKTYTFKRSEQPTPTAGLSVRTSKNDFDSAPTIYVYDKAENQITGKWPGVVMEEDEDGYIWNYDGEEETLIFILTHNGWRSTPDNAPGITITAGVSYDKTSNETTPLPAKEPGSITVKYVDSSGNTLKTIQRVGVVGKNYVTYPADEGAWTDFDQYSLTKQPENKTGIFSANGEVTYIYTKDGGGNNGSDDNDDNGGNGGSGDNGDNGGNGGSDDNGDNGGNGSSGDNGNTSGNGSSGDNGNTGGNGSSGDNGNTGDNGSSGDSGNTGGNGSSGDNGNTGGNGSLGNNGSSGGNGSSGNNGSSGGNGSSGNNSSLTGGNSNPVTEMPTIVTVTTQTQVNNGSIVTDNATNASFQITGNAASKTAEYIVSTSKEEIIKIPDTLVVNKVVYKVTSVADDAFSNNTKVKTITIGNNVKTIGKSAFSNCKNLKNVSIPSSVTAIEENAFYKCTKLTTVTIPAGTKKIGKNAFKGCRNLKKIIVKSTKLKSSKIGANAFKGISSKATITVPAKKLTAYKKLFKTKGVGSKVKFKK